MPQVNVTGRPNGLIIILLLLAIVLMGLLVFAAFLQLMFQPAETFPGFSAVRSWAELLYFISGVLILITAIIAIFGARDQLRLLNASMQIDVHHRNAAVFLEMEQRWGSGEMVEARKKIGELMGSLNPNHEDTAEIRVAFEKHLAGLWASVDKSEYMEIMRPIYFLEGIGLMCARRYLDPADVDELIGPALIEYRTVFVSHILTRRAETGDTDAEIEKVDLFGNALRLIEPHDET